MDYFLLILAIILLICGLLGCIIPAIPGPPLGFFGLFALNFTRWDSELTAKLLIIFAILTVIVTVMDFLLPGWLTKKFGGSRAGVVGSTIGLLIGMFFVPIGLIIGPFLGAFVGEVAANKNKNEALKSALGSLLGFFVGTGVKLAVSGSMVYYAIISIF